MRNGVLEILGEVIHTFIEDDRGPPSELILMFTGKRLSPRQARIPHLTSFDAQPSASPSNISFNSDTTAPWVESSISSPRIEAPVSDVQSNDSFHEQERSLICAFNYPAVALTLGGERWSELRIYYIQLAKDKSPKVQRTLAASLGEMAKIIGTRNAMTDLAPLLWDILRHGDEDAKNKAVECLELFVSAIDEDARAPVASGLEDIWSTSSLGWREREACARTFSGLSSLLRNHGGVIRAVVGKALTDNVAAVREEAIAQVWTALQISICILIPVTCLQLPSCLEGLGLNSSAAHGLRADVDSLAASPSYRRRAM